MSLRPPPDLGSQFGLGGPPLSRSDLVAWARGTEGFAAQGLRAMPGCGLTCPKAQWCGGQIPMVYEERGRSVFPSKAHHSSKAPRPDQHIQSVPVLTWTALGVEQVPPRR